MNAAHRHEATRSRPWEVRPAMIGLPELGAQSKIATALLAAILLWTTPTLAADNFAINNATGTFTVLKSTDDGTGAQQLNVLSAPSSGTSASVPYTSSSALAANTVIKASAGNLYSFEVAADSTLSGAAWWIMIYDAAAAPADGAVTPTKCYAMPSGTTGYSAAFFTPLRLATGIVIGVSTTGCFSKTASTHAFISGDAK